MAKNTTADASQNYNPKTAGQSFSVYRYDEEGYKAYQKLDLLPVGGDVANGYALELCSGWKRVDENGNDVNTSSTSSTLKIDLSIDQRRTTLREPLPPLMQTLSSSWSRM